MKWNDSEMSAMLPQCYDSKNNNSSMFIVYCYIMIMCNTAPTDRVDVYDYTETNGRDYRLDAHAHNPFCIGTMVVSSCLSKSIVAGCRNNVCNRLILHSKGLEQVCLVVTLSCSLHKCLYT